ncbi:MAG: hypothetical protein JWQ35_880 [Bacteriovoracaceae bacterium]|nr:hypothetical protein [Bacteriovoracaceae bacterium]
MKKYARYYGALGAIFFIFGAITSIMLQGTLKYFGIVEFLVGLFGLAVFTFYFIGEALRTISQKREILFGLVGGLFLLLILIGANVVAHSQFGERKFDTTANKVHSLSSESINLIKNIGANIKIIAFFTKGAQQKPFLDDLAQKYSYQSKKIKFEIIDPDQNPAQVKNYEGAPDEVIVRNEDTKKSMKLTTMTEEALTSAIKRVMSAKTKVVYFLQGHGEGDLEDDKTSQGLYIAKILLENEGYTVRALNLASKTEIPSDANMVAAWGATRALSKAEVDALTRYFERGGDLVVGQNPILAATKDKIVPSGFDPLLERAGLEFKPSILLEQQLQLLRGNVINAKLPITDFGKHQITGSLGAQAVVEIFLAQPVLQKKDFKDNKVTRTILASTSDKSWAESDIASIFITQKPTPKGQLPGPLAIGEAAELTVSDQVKDSLSKTGKLVAYGDASFATNQLIQSGYNRDLFLNSFNYLGGEDGTLSIRPKAWTSSTLEINESQRLVVYFASIFLIPQIIMGLGAIIWIFRRSRV